MVLMQLMNYIYVIREIRRVGIYDMPFGYFHTLSFSRTAIKKPSPVI